MDSEKRKALARRLHDACHISGEFVLRSGKTANEYFDKYQLSANAAMLFSATQLMAELIPTGVEVIAGLELGAIPVVTMLSHHTGLPAAFVRKKAKKYGTTRLIEGASILGKSVLVIEDIVSSGGQIIISSNDMRAQGAKITHALAVVNRKEGAAGALKEVGIDLISLLDRDDFADFGD
jgi:orotate phosphoribosyltransferase